MASRVSVATYLSRCTDKRAWWFGTLTADGVGRRTPIGRTRLGR
jgi:hypothetical protein